VQAVLRGALRGDFQGHLHAVIQAIQVLLEVRGLKGVVIVDYPQSQIDHSVQIVHNTASTSTVYYLLR